MQSDKITNPAEQPETPPAKKRNVNPTTKKAAQPKTATVKEKAPAKKTAAKTPSKKATAAKTGTTAGKPTKKIQIRFEIFFSTKFGESLLISGAHPALGAEATYEAPLMEYIDDQKWAITLELDKQSIKDGQLNYTYLVRLDDGALSLSAPYQLSIPATATSITVRDSWNAPGFVQNALLNDAVQAFTDQPLETKKPVSTRKKKGNHRFIITAPQIAAGKAVCLIGQEPALGGWDPMKAVLLENLGNSRWQIELTLAQTSQQSPYKYGIYDLASRQLESFETGANRILEEDTTAAALLIQQDGFLRTN